MKLNIDSIPEKGMTVPLSASEPWVVKMVEEAFSEEKPDPQTIHGQVRLTRFEKNLHLEGSVGLTLHPGCDRCLEPVDYSLEVPLQMNLSPLYESPHQKEELSGQEEEVELTKDDLEFSFYEGSEINLKDIVQEQMVLSLPLRYVCSEDCRGLCPKCGQNLNAGSCPCDKSAPVDPRWAALEGFKPAKK